MIQRYILFFALALTAMLASAQDAGGVPRDLLSKFRTGVNITRWFCYVGNPNDEDHFRDYLTEQDFAAFRHLRVTFVRLCISPEVIDESGAPKPRNLELIDAALERFRKAGIAVLWDLHDNGQLKLDEPGHDNSGFVRFWGAIARHYRGKLENEVVFELLNEPQFNKNPEVWYALQERTVQAIRAADPRRTIMVASTSWDGPDTFVKMAPLAESNLIYTFHCYDPFFFTHQGASWVGDQPKLFRSVPFPSSPEAVSAMIDQIPPQFQGALKWYGEQHFDAKYVRGRIAGPAGWGREHHVPVVLGEFGSYPPVSPVESRTRWFEAMRAAVDAEHVPNAIWGYDDAMGLGREMKDGELKLDPVTLKAFFGN
ncbi:MAG TPA: cellulase family glycosylhydrolase [Fimbriimonadaceae bacterium]|nr:cellulase family glycosylhydrolase [Fimbriimonadaceae bacterium]